MKIFSSRCRIFEYIVTTASPAAVDLESAAIGVPNTFSDCLLLMVGVERGDSTSMVLPSGNPPVNDPMSSRLCTC